MMIKKSLTFDRTLHNILPFVDFLYILQLEDYNSRAYTRWISSRLTKRGFQKTARIVWTKKAKILLTISLLLYFLAVLKISLLIPNYWWMLLSVVIVTLLIPYLILLANLIFSIVDIWAKKQIIDKAKNILQKSDCTVVAVVGSQGKTSTRSLICQLLEGVKNYHTPPDNNNVALSLARDIIQSMTNKTEVYVVEFGELYRGDLACLYRFLQPKIIVMTAIGSQHMTQFGSQVAIDNEFLSLLEVAMNSTLIVNSEDDGVRRVCARSKHKTRSYSTETLASLKIPSEPEIFKIAHMRANTGAAVLVAQQLGLSSEHIVNRIQHLESVDRRLKVTKQGSITILDDSYNISPESAGAALDYLKTLKGRKVVVTGGIVDQGDNENTANETFGRKLAEVADVVIVAQNRLALAVTHGIHAGSKNVQVLPSISPDMTPEILRSVLKPEDCVLIQNELPDLYWS